MNYQWQFNGATIADATGPNLTLTKVKPEAAGDYTMRLALLEELKSLPFGAVWDEHCRRCDVPIGIAWLADVKRYEREVLASRG